MYIDNKRFQTHMLRLGDGEDVVQKTKAFVEERALKNVFILTAIGSLKTVVIKESANLPIQHLERSWRILGLFAFAKEGHMRIRCLLINDMGEKIAGELLEGSQSGSPTDILFGEHLITPRKKPLPHQS